MASDIVIQVEKLSKQYRLGEVSTGTMCHDINRWWHRVRGKTDPYTKITETNDRTTVGDSEYVWALQNVEFEVNRGDVLGIVGRNGAGKSTLLKILSRVTAPTSGEVRILGRVGSLLEVGTGFHYELTGRENIYLNGAILGMTKTEVSSKLDEIVDFSGCERYIDTPVKRYSSGMMVRLGFAVAAHLETEILIVDEVLAVGDADFQKRCIGKMKDVAGHGRTVLFVSHNMAAVKRLCTTGLLLSQGGIESVGTAEEIVSHYRQPPSPEDITHPIDLRSHASSSGPRRLQFKEIWFDKARYGPNDEITLFVTLLANEPGPFMDVSLSVHITVDDDLNVIHLNNDFMDWEPVTHRDGSVYRFCIPHHQLKPRTYSVTLWLGANGEEEDYVENAATFAVTGSHYTPKRPNQVQSILETPFTFELMDVSSESVGASVP